MLRVRSSTFGIRSVSRAKASARHERDWLEDTPPIRAVNACLSPPVDGMPRTAQQLCRPGAAAAAKLDVLEPESGRRPQPDPTEFGVRRPSGPAPPRRGGAQAFWLKAFEISASVAFSASLTWTPPKPRKPPSLAASATCWPMLWSQAL